MSVVKWIVGIVGVFIIINVVCESVTNNDSSPSSISVVSSSAPDLSITPRREVSYWSNGTFVDEFGDRTSNKYAIGRFQGQMYNTATQGSDARIRIYFQDDGTSFVRIDEYNRSPVTGFRSGTPYKFSFRTSTGKEAEFTWNWFNTTDMSFGPQNTATMRNILLSDSNVRLRVVNLRNSTSRYMFNINTSGLKEALSNI